MVTIENRISQTQGQIFEYAVNQGYDLESFALLYMQSHFCKSNFDRIYSRYQTAEPEESMDFLLPEIGCLLKKADALQSGSVAYWMGYTYRLLYFCSGLSSKEIVLKIPVKKMLASYPGLHTIDEGEAVKILCEEFRLPFSEIELYE